MNNGICLLEGKKNFSNHGVQCFGGVFLFCFGLICCFFVFVCFCFVFWPYTSSTLLALVKCFPHHNIPTSARPWDSGGDANPMPYLNLAKWACGIGLVNCHTLSLWPKWLISKISTSLKPVQSQSFSEASIYWVRDGGALLSSGLVAARIIKARKCLCLCLFLLPLHK